MSDVQSLQRSSVEDLLYHRSKEYARRVYMAHLKAKRSPPVPKAKASDDCVQQVDAVHTRLLQKYPYRLLLSR